jgi:hypothetical protein
MAKDRVILVGAASMGAYVERLVDEYREDAQKIVLLDRPKLDDTSYLAIEGNRRQRRAHSSKKLRLKGLRP